MEQWKKITDYPNYSVSNQGQVRNDVTGRILKQSRVGGYSMIGLREKGMHKMIYVHRLVAFAFVENPENYTEVNHINAIKSDNRAENIEWCSRAHNMRHAYAHNLIHLKRGQESSVAKLTEQDVLEIRNLRSQGYTLMKLTEIFNVGLTAIYNITIRKTWSHI